VRYRNTRTGEEKLVRARKSNFHIR
jgi:hypothetical protein